MIHQPYRGQNIYGINELNHVGPSWFVDTEGSDTNGNGSSDYPLEQSSMPTMCLPRMIRLSLTQVHTLGIFILDHSLTLVDSILFGQRPILDGGNNGRVLEVTNDSDISIKDLIFSNGYSTSQGGGAILASSGTLSI